ncbi:MAG: hypothetical protein LKF31_05020 [Muribaculaceae bacterium]|jgi:hypothetical protein|nr:hypothetical protein [Muribaculaceae bacterium]
MKKRIICVASLFLAGALTMMGFSTCIRRPLAYGCPPEFNEIRNKAIVFSGAITDTLGKSLKGIKVCLNNDSSTEVLTDSVGKFTIHIKGMRISNHYTLNVTDPSGVYAPTEYVITNVTFSNRRIANIRIKLHKK